MAQTDPDGALTGLRVLDLSHGIAGPFAARLLGDHGADVIKIERPITGDFARTLPPLKQDAPFPEQSLLFQYLNWNKRSLALDLRLAENKPTLQKLVEQSDIVIESFRPGRLESWGLGVDQLLDWQPKLVVTSVTNFGQTGPYAQYAASDLTLQALSGIMQISGQVDREPLKHGLSQSFYCAGLTAAYASIMAYTAAQADQFGEHVDVSIHECLASELVLNQSYYAFLGAVQGRRAIVQDPFAGEPIATRKGYLAFQTGGGAPFETFAELFDRPEFLEKRFSSPPEREKRVAEVKALLEECVADRDAKEVFLAGAQKRLLLGVVQSAEDLLHCEHLKERQSFVEIDHPATSTQLRFPAELAKLSLTPTSVRRRSPTLDEHRTEILAQIGRGR
ncbi:CaiB/BaiF CoA transferase family protein [Zwartia panacis]|uniref:CaiB/BaiF CoA transferase family protein n=1 Tax=Zwartia panacis TaxID=2683345 RepID=UPI0025B48976|nr:CoA transferase [Zwartia panacis]MDN4018144.1 CoA transferase [Zwartia panacis]